MAEKQKYYVVWKGRETGIFDSWEACKKQVDGFEGAQYKAFPTENAARMAFAQNYWHVVKNNRTDTQPRPNDFMAAPITDSIAVDAACSGNPGVMEYRGVMTNSRQEVFHLGPFKQATNNIGEFLAIVHALALIEQGRLHVPIIYSDSITAQAWVRARTCKTKLQTVPENEPVFELIHRAETWLNTHTFDTRILKWHTEIWGEIPADFGRK